MARKKQETAVPQEKPNLRFVGKEQEINGKIVKQAHLTYINDGQSVYLLPEDESLQRQGFTHPNAADIIRLYPELYKHPVEKGKKVNS